MTPKNNQTVLGHLQTELRSHEHSVRQWSEYANSSRAEVERIRHLIAEVTGKPYEPVPETVDSIAAQCAQLTEKLLKTEADVRARELTITELRARIEVLNKEKCAAEGVAESWKAEFHRLKEWARGDVNAERARAKTRTSLHELLDRALIRWVK